MKSEAGMNAMQMTCSTQRAGRRRILTCCLSLLTAISILPSTARGEEAPMVSVVITPDPTTQSALDGMMQAASRDDLAQRISALLKSDTKDRSTVIEQLLVFSVRPDDSACRRVVLGHILKALADETEAVARALAPQLDNQDEGIRILTRKILTGLEDRSAVRPPDFSPYRAIIEDDVRNGRQPQTSLIDYMFESDAGTAIQTLVRAFQLRDGDEIRSILWTEHVVSELLWKRRLGFVKPDAVDPTVVKEIESASRHMRWWVRLYAAKIATGHPEFANDETEARLANDASPSVRKAVAPPIAEDNNSGRS